ncbi:hypothetical protein PG991_015510 [Apiospora marii]|uniref:Uncharacterized protein n=1 Tax=Apiospora marii TaxID=335849 RepID=A0ABR1R1V3_9PEZI
MKTSSITRLLLVLLGAPELLQARAIPSKGLEQRFTDLNPPLNATELTHCGTARCHALGVAVVDKRAGVPGVPVRGGGAAGGSGAGRGAGEAAGGGAAVGRPGAGSGAGGGDAGSGAQTGGQLGEFGTGQSSTGKRPLEEGSSPPAEPDSKVPKTGTDAAAADDALAGDASPGNAPDASGVTDITSRGYNPVRQESDPNLDVYEVKAGDKVVDNISIDREQKLIISDDLQNAADPTPNRLKAWEVEMSLFVHQSGQSPSDLRGISYTGVSEANTQPTINRIAEVRGDSFTIERSSTVPADQADFQALTDTLLGRSTQSLLKNSPVGKEITSIEVGFSSLEDLDLKFIFG